MRDLIGKFDNKRNVDMIEESEKSSKVASKIAKLTKSKIVEVLPDPSSDKSVVIFKMGTYATRFDASVLKAIMGFGIRWLEGRDGGKFSVGL